ncbi:MAG: PAS domain S-box protein, partial [Syntrophomonas sp.]
LIKGGMVLVEDISDQRQFVEDIKKNRDELEIRVKERTAELEKINQSLKIQIAERELMEKALMASENRMRGRLNYLNMLIDNLNELFFTYNTEGIINFINKKSLDVLGYEPGELRNNSILKLIPERFKKILLEEIDKRLIIGEISSYEITLLSKNGEEKLFRFNSSPIWGEGVIIGGMALGEDISAYRQAKAAQLLSEEKFAAAFHLSPEMIAISSLEDGRYIEVNDAFIKLFGYSREEVIGKTVRELNIWVNPQNRGRLQRMILKNPIVRGIEDHFRKKSGETWIGICSFARLNIDGEMCILTVSTNITEKRHMEEELVKAAKLESLGVLAGGLAHDFNNLLTIILGNITLAKLVFPDKSDLLDLVDEAEKATLQARGLTKQLLTFARGGAPIKKTTSLNSLLKQSVKFCLSGSNVSSKFVVHEDAWNVEIDEGQISQVINNLVINAMQAMPEGGLIVITIQNIVLDGHYKSLPLKSGMYVKLSIEDEGNGIPEEYLNRIFDPYFTTKQNGTGLGLATSYSIINRHGGYICCESQLGTGTTFHMYLPASIKDIEVDGERVPVPSQGRGRILVMDDNYRIREMLREMLVNLGYEVNTVSEGAQSIEKYSEAMLEGNPFTAVIMDLTVRGGMGGKKALEKLLEIDPGVKVIVSSGYSHDPIMSQYHEWGFKGLLAKPYSIGELAKVLQTTVEEGD